MDRGIAEDGAISPKGDTEHAVSKDGGRPREDKTIKS